jgi:hypothetical protein
MPKAASSLRAIAWRIVGALAIVGAASGFVLVACQSDAKDAILDWITFGLAAHNRTGDLEGQDLQKGIGSRERK